MERGEGQGQGEREKSEREREREKEKERERERERKKKREHLFEEVSGRHDAGALYLQHSVYIICYSINQQKKKAA